LAICSEVQQPDGTGINPSPNQPIFVIGDTQTGADSIHRYLERAGVRSVANAILQSGQLLPLHMHAEENERRFLDYVRASGLRAFGDFPGRFFFRALEREFPDALFILPLASSLPAWLEGMRTLADRQGLTLDFEALAKNHWRVNSDVSQLMTAHQRRFLELDMGQTDAVITAKLACFLQLPPDIPFERLLKPRRDLLSCRAEL
jgi:hypothetical protein